MTTFSHVDADADALKISTAPRMGIARDGGVLVSTNYSDPASIGVFVSKEDAPEVALAILRAAGFADHSHGGPIESALASLASIGKKKEAAAKLDADALELFNAGQKALNLDTFEALDEIPAELGEVWRRVVKAARKIAATS